MSKLSLNVLPVYGGKTRKEVIYFVVSVCCCV